MATRKPSRTRGAFGKSVFTRHLSLLLFLAAATSGGGATLTWTGAGDQTSWGDPYNWDPDHLPLPRESVLFQGSTGLQVNRDDPSIPLATVAFAPSAGAFEIQGAQMFLFTGVVNYSGTTQTFDIKLHFLDNVQIQTAGSGALVFNDTLTGDSNNSITLTFDTGADIFANGAIQQNTFPLTVLKRGTGTLYLNGSANHTGGTLIENGTLVVNHSSALGTGLATVETGGVLVLSNATHLANAHLVLSGTGTGNGALIGNNSSVSGTVELGGNTLIHSNHANFALSGLLNLHTYDLVFDGVKTTLQSGVIGSGRITVNSSTLAITGNTPNTFSGNITVQGDSLLQLNKTGATAVSGNIALISGTVAPIAPNQFSPQSIIYFYGGALELIPSAPQRVAGLRSNGAVGNINVTSGASLTLTVAGDFEYSGDIDADGSFTLIKQGSGVQAIGGQNNASMLIILEEGELIRSSLNGLGTSGTLVFAGGTYASFPQDAIDHQLILESDAHINVLNSLLTFFGDISLGGTGRTFYLDGTPERSMNLWGNIKGDNGGGIAFRNATLTGTASVQLNSTVAYTYTGATTVGEGVHLTIGGINNLAIIPGDLVVEQGGRVFIDLEPRWVHPIRIDLDGELYTTVHQTVVQSLFGSGTLQLTSGGFGSERLLQIAEGDFSGSIIGEETVSSILRKAGSGTLALTGSNAFNSLELNGGVLSANSADALSAPGGVTFRSGTLLATQSFTVDTLITLTGTEGGNLAAQDGVTLTIASDITGNGPLTINSLDHGGTVILTSSTSFDNAALVHSGTFLVNGTMGNYDTTQVGLFINGGATLGGTGVIYHSTVMQDDAILAAGNSPGTLVFHDLSLSDNTILQFELNTPNVEGGPDNDFIYISNRLILDGRLQIDNGNLFDTGSYTLFHVDGILFNYGLKIDKAPAGYNYTIAISGGHYVKVELLVEYEGIQWWNGSHTTADGTVYGGSGIWNGTSTNWTNASATYAAAWDHIVARFAGTSGTVTVVDNVAISGLQFVIDGYHLTGTGQLVLSGSDGTEIFVNPDVTASIDTVLSGTGDLVKRGNGTLILGGSNTYVGQTVIERGLLAISDNANLGHADNGVTLDGGTLRLANGLDLSRSIAIQSSGAVDVEADASATVSGVISGSGSFHKTGSGLLTLVGYNTHSGGTILQGGTLSISSDANLGTGNLKLEEGTLHITADLTTSKSIELAGAGGKVIETLGNATASGLIHGSGALVKRGTGLLYLDSINTYTGNTRIEEGTLAIHHGNSVGDSASQLVFAGGTLQTRDYAVSMSRHIVLEANAFVDMRQRLSLDGTISGTGNLVVVGSSLLDLEGNNTFTGDIVINDGHVLVGTDNNLGDAANKILIAGGQLSATTSFTSGREIELSGTGKLGVISGTFTHTGIISGTGALEVNVAFPARLHLTGNNTFTGNVIVTPGSVLSFASDASLGNADNQIYLDGGFLAADDHVAINRLIHSFEGGFVTSGTLELQNTLSGTGVLFKFGTGAVILSGSLDFAGDIHITEGSFVVQTDLSNFTGHVYSDATLVFELATDSSFGQTVSGGTLVQNGSAYLDLTSASIYTDGVVVNSGTLAINNTPFATLHLNGGALSPGGVGTATDFYTKELVLNGGTILFDLETPAGPSDHISANTAVLSGSTRLSFNLSGSSFSNHLFQLIDGLDGNWDLDLLTLEGLPGSAQLFLDDDGSTLYLTLYNGTPVSAAVLQNSGTVYTPTDALFLVSCDVVTGKPHENNEVAILHFDHKGSLLVSNTLTVSTGTIGVVRGTGYLSGDTLYIPTDLNIVGPGRLVTDIDILVDGNTQVSAGELEINHVLGGSNVMVKPEAGLRGSGIIAGNLVNHGTLKPGNSPGTLTVLGNYTQTGTLELEIASTKEYDRLIVGGNASLSGTLTVIPYGGYQLKHGQKFTFLEADSITGAFDKTILPGGFRPRFLEDDGDLTLLLAPESYTQMAVTPNQKNLAKALDKFIDGKGDRDAVSEALDHLSADEYPKAFEEMLPHLYASLGNITLEQSFNQGQLLQQRFGTMALAPRGFSMSGMRLPVVAEKSTGKKDIMLATEENPWGVWVQAHGLFAEATLSNIPNYHHDSGGFLIGADYRWNDRFATGLFAGYHGTIARYEGDGRTEIDSSRFGAYATYVDGTGFYANAMLSGGFSRYTVRRNIDFGDLHRSTRSTPSGGEFAAMLGGGYDWRIGGFSLGPIASAQYTYVKVNGVTERGAKSLDLRIDDYDLNSLRTTLGARVAYTWLPMKDVAVIPELRASWQHEYLNGSRSLWATLDGGTGPGFQYVAAAPERNALFASAALNFLVGNRWSANISYNLNAGGGDFRSHTISAGVNVSF